MFYNKPKSHFIKRFFVTYLIIIAFLFTFLGGTFVGYQSRQAKPETGGEVINRGQLPPYLLEDVDFNLFWDVWKIAKGKYLKQPVVDTKLFYGALSGVISALGDPYSSFLDPEITQKFNEELSGTFEGIGAEIGIKKEQLLIIAPLPNTPAARAGLKAGDRILEINDKDTFGMSIEQAVSLIRGPQKTEVILTIFRERFEKPEKISIVRDEIHIENVTWRMIDNIAYIKIIQFNGETVQKFQLATQELMLQNPKAIILDLRGNPGGYFDAAVDIASFWIPSPEIVVSQKYQGDKKDDFRSRGQALLKSFPTIVLVNGGSASASEIVAGALQDHAKAKLIGEKTFGKGSVQDYEIMRDGSSVKITIAEWLTPKGRLINGEGIAPDIEIELTKEDYENDEDPQLQKAVELLSENPKR